MPELAKPSRWAQTRAPAAVILIRLMVGLVFFEEGIQKFLFPAVQGAGRFARIGIPAPVATAYFVGAVEIVCGALIVIGLFTRLAAIPLLIDISVAIASTKVPICSATDTGAFTCRNSAATVRGRCSRRRAPISRCCSACCSC